MLLMLLLSRHYFDDNMTASMLNDCLEINRIFITSINTAKNNNNPPASFLYYLSMTHYSSD